MISESDFNFIKDVYRIAVYKCWDEDSGDKEAQKIIDEIHKGKYGSYEGVWVQFPKLLERLKTDVK